MTKIKQQAVFNMANTTPNKESIRRICILYGGSFCILHVDTGAEHVEVLTDIADERLPICEKELEAWCGMKFKLFNERSNDEKTEPIRLSGEKILPIKMT